MDWRPIETAPKNPEGEFYGPVVLIWCTADNTPWPASWGPGGPDNKGCWVIEDGGRQANEIYPDDASHWFPITPPEEA